jgi:hypothetical protein
MTQEETEQRVVPVQVLEGLVEGWRTKVSRYDFDGSAEEYRAYMDVHESCADDIETVIRDTAKPEDTDDR